MLGAHSYHIIYNMAVLKVCLRRARGETAETAAAQGPPFARARAARPDHKPAMPCPVKATLAPFSRVHTRAKPVLKPPQKHSSHFSVNFDKNFPSKSDFSLSQLTETPPSKIIFSSQFDRNPSSKRHFFVLFEIHI